MPSQGISGNAAGLAGLRRAYFEIRAPVGGAFRAENRRERVAAAEPGKSVDAPFERCDGVYVQSYRKRAYREKLRKHVGEGRAFQVYDIGALFRFCTVKRFHIFLRAGRGTGVMVKVYFPFDSKRCARYENFSLRRQMI